MPDRERPGIESRPPARGEPIEWQVTRSVMPCRREWPVAETLPQASVVADLF